MKIRILFAFVLTALIALGSRAQVPQTGAGVPVPQSNQSFLLDTLSVSASLAYSSRKLRAAYVGNAMSVTRSSDSTTSNIGFTGGGDLGSLSFCNATNCGLNTWYDQTGNTTNATQTTAANQPVIVTAGTSNKENTHVCGGYTNAATSNLTYTASIAQPVTIAIMFHLSAATSGRHLTDGVSGSNRLAFGVNPGPVWFMYAGGGATTGGTADTSAHAGIGVYDDAHSNTNGYIDATNPITGQFAGTDSMAQQYVGAQITPASIDGNICEYIVFASALNSTDRGKIRTSWQSYWGTP